MKPQISMFYNMYIFFEVGIQKLFILEKEEEQENFY